MAVALRILNCIHDRIAPDYDDVKKLRSWLDPKEWNTDPDELACMVINAEIKRKREARDKPIRTAVRPVMRASV